MANYICSARSNYFKVKDVEIFKNDVGMFPVSVHEKAGTFCITCEDPDGGGWPSHWYDDETGEFQEVDFFAEVSKHLAVGEVAVFMEVGAEKLRYLVGQAVAINSRGEQRWVNLESIYDLAKELTDTPEAISYATY